MMSRAASSPARRWARTLVEIPGGPFSAVSSSGQSTFSASGATITDATGLTLVDYHAAFGPLILGHCDPEILSAFAVAIDETITLRISSRRNFNSASVIAISIASSTRKRLPHARGRRIYWPLLTAGANGYSPRGRAQSRLPTAVARE